MRSAGGESVPDMAVEKKKVTEQKKKERTGSGDSRGTGNPDTMAVTPILKRDADGLFLTDGTLKLRGDFRRLLPRIRYDNLGHELIVKAARQKRRADAADAASPLIADATAGLGEDSFLLAAAGFSVLLFERDPVIAALLEDALCRAAADPDLQGIAARMTLRKEDSLAALPRLERAPDVIVLDPMFPERQKSALVKKKFQLLQSLENPCTEEDAEALLHAAFAAKPGKILVKRPKKVPYLAGVRPAYSITGSTIRYDCILLKV